MRRYAGLLIAFIMAVVLQTETGMAATAPGFLFAAADGSERCAPLTPEHPDWLRYRRAFIEPSGRVIDTANGRVSHSEGQGYGLLLAVAYDDRATFELLRHWTFANLAVRSDGLLAWRWQPNTTPAVADTNNATDGDLLVAWALAEAALRWHDEDSLAAAKKMAAAILDNAAPMTRQGRVLSPGVHGFSDEEQPDGPVVNPSYWVFPALERLDQLTGDRRWQEIQATGFRLLRRARFGLLKLPPEWLALGGGRLTPAANFEPVFGYNAIRIPLYLAMLQQPPEDLLKPYVRLWTPHSPIGPVVVELETGAARDPMVDAGYRLAIAAAGRAVKDPAFARPVTLSPSQLYYSASLELLAKILMRERYAQCQ